MKTIHKIETWAAAIFFSFVFFFIIHLFRNWWIGLSIKEKQKFKRGFIRDFIITTYVVIVLIIISFATKHTTWINNIANMAR